MSAWNENLSPSQLLDRIIVPTTTTRRSSVSKIFHRLRSGSLPAGWTSHVGGISVHPSSNESRTVSPFETPRSEANASLLLPTGFQPEPHDESVQEMERTKNVSVSASKFETTTCVCSTISARLLAKDISDTLNNISTCTCEHAHDEFLPSASLTDEYKVIYSNDAHQSSPISMECYPLTLTTPPPRKPFAIVPCSEEEARQSQGNKNLSLVVSALYGKLLVVMGIAFPMAEVISTYIPPSFYDGFYLYLYFGSITFMICIYANVLREKSTRSMRYTLKRISTVKSRLTFGQGTVVARISATSNESRSQSSGTHHPAEGSTTDSEDCESGSHEEASEGSNIPRRVYFGSFYLRMGAVAFGIGSMIYSGLEFGQYFELEPDTKCHNFMIALTPAVRMIFTFMQMYFIFLNSKLAVYKLEIGAQFGLMHMIGTNLCVWLSVLVQETRHEILMFYNPDNGTVHYSGSPYHFYTNKVKSLSSSHTVPGEHESGTLNATLLTTLGTHVGRVKRGLKGPYSFLECRRSDIMGSLVQNASPFLFPCTIEFSLICAAILFVMWKSLAKMSAAKDASGPHSNSEWATMNAANKRSPHHYSVDCARANKGLFTGIFVLVMTIISLILFFVLIPRPEYQALAVLEVNMTELVLYTTTTLAVLLGMWQMRELRYVRSRNLELDNILLIVSQTGSFIYNVFTIIGGHFTMKNNTGLILVVALTSLIQLLFQTLFILDASKRSAANSDQARRKPGREVVTFLLVTNLAMWAINTLEKSRADSHPVQLKFYGVWAWTIITHISMPLAIFYRFHSTVCLCEIWKRAGKIKSSLYHHNC